MNEEDKLYYIWLAEAFGAGSKLGSKILKAVGSVREIYENRLNGLKPSGSMTEKEIISAREHLIKRTLDDARRIYESCGNKGVSVITPECSEYPSALRFLDDMPLVLYYVGNIPDTSGYLSTAVVGTRKMTDYGRNMAYSLGLGLAYGGSIVVSGMALGADSMALIGALDAGGVVIAVLGSGVDVVYPREHLDIYKKIMQRGAVISEYPPGTPPLGSHFPVRNRIMSGLADATVVVEADLHSGSLITAAHAFDQGKKVFAVPGKIGESGSEGTNALLRDGASPVVTAEDILAEFEFIYPQTVSVQRAHSLLRGVDMDTTSASSMSKSRVVSRIGDPNYYGSGSYGGRRKKSDMPVQEANPPEILRTPSSRTVIIPDHDKPAEDNKIRKNEKQTVNSERKAIPAQKIELDMLDENEIKVYNIMKPNVPMLPDELVGEGLQIKDVMSSLTILEMAGAVESGNGGYFIRIQQDDIMLSENS